MSDNKGLLREWFPVDAGPMVKESREQNGGKLVVSGIIQKADTKNQNKRIYPSAILRREVENYQKLVREQRALGELDHPESATVSLDRVSHIIREIWWDGNDVKGKVEILQTPMGKILESLIDSGITIGISSRGVGSTTKTNEGCDVVSEDYQLICFDIVADPSTPGAFLKEGKSIIDSAPRFSKEDRIYRSLNDIYHKVLKK